jgi:hypothetical protein
MATPDCVILEVGASDGANALELIHHLGHNFDRYYVTDAYQSISAYQHEGKTYLYHDLQPLMLITDRWIVYHDDTHAIFPLDCLVRRIFHCAPPRPSAGTRETVLVQPSLLALSDKDPRIKLETWDVINPWYGEKADIIKIANVLNRHYFHEDQIKLAVENCMMALKGNGILMIVENRTDECWSLFRKIGKSLVLEREGQQGSDISELVQMIGPEWRV